MRSAVAAAEGAAARLAGGYAGRALARAHDFAGHEARLAGGYPGRGDAPDRG